MVGALGPGGMDDQESEVERSPENEGMGLDGIHIVLYIYDCTSTAYIYGYNMI